MNSPQKLILSIDATRPHIRAVLLSGEGAETSIEEDIVVDGSAWWNSYFDLDGSYRDNSTLNGNNGELATNDETAAAAYLAPFPIREILEQFSERKFTESIVILPPHQATTLRLELPFTQTSYLAQVAPMEAQDKLPFSVDMFHCHARPIAQPIDQKQNTTSHEQPTVRVDLYPEHILANLLQECHEANFEPSVLTIPAALGEFCRALYPKYIKENCAIVFSSEGAYSVSFLIDGEPSTYFSIPFDASTSRTEFPGEHLLNVWISATEELNQCHIERIYFVGEREGFAIWDAEEVKKPVEFLSYEDLVPKSSPELGLSCLVTTGFDEKLSRYGQFTPNYRTGKFLFRPYVRNLIDGIRSLLLPIAVIILAIAILLPMRFYAREYRITSLQDEINSVVKEALRKPNIEQGTELTIVRQEIATVRDILQQLGTSTSIPLQKELALILETLKDVDVSMIRRLNILSDKTIIECFAASYSVVEKINEAFQKHSENFCDVEVKVENRSRQKATQLEIILKKVCST